MAVAENASGCTGAPTRSRAERPPDCSGCGARSWWNGWRRVFVVVQAGGEVRREWWLARAKCGACRLSFTCYPPWYYPRRQYQLDVVADVAAAVAIGGESAHKAAARVTASATSARRWTAWVAELAPASVLLAAAQRLEPDAPVGAGASAVVTVTSVATRAAAVLAALEELGAALIRRGVELVSRTGLGRVLEWQRREHGDVVQLVAEPRSLSPPMALGWIGASR